MELELGKKGVSLKKKTYACPVPSALDNMFSTPEDFRAFLRDIHPNICYALTRQGLEVDVAGEVISALTIYFLEVSVKKGICRYQLYDPIKYPGIPYHKWFLSQIPYFVMSHNKQIRLWHGILATRRDKHASNPIEDVRDEMQEEKMVASLYVQKFIEILRNMANKGETAFERHALPLLESRMAGETNVAYAEKAGVPYSSVTSWTIRLRELFNAYREEEYA